MCPCRFIKKKQTRIFQVISFVEKNLNVTMSSLRLPLFCRERAFHLIRLIPSSTCFMFIKVFQRAGNMQWTLGKPGVLHPLLIGMLNPLHIPSASTISLEAYFKALIHRGLNTDQKLSEIIKVSAGSSTTSEDALVSMVWLISLFSHWWFIRRK